MTKGKLKTVGTWVLQILLALVLVQASRGRLAGNPMVVTLFENYGYQDKFYLLVGALELAGAAGLLIPRLSGYAAGGLIVIMIGALATHLAHREAQAVVPAVLLVLLSLVAYARRPQFLRRATNPSE